MIAQKVAEVVHIDRARELLDACQVPRNAQRMIWAQAIADVQLEHSDLPKTTQRALAARRISASIARWARERAA